MPRRALGALAILGAVGMAGLPAYMAFQQGPPPRAKKRQEKDKELQSEIQRYKAPGSMWGNMKK